jgi:hypothetical protein
MDNECSKAVENHIRSNKMNIQIVPLHNHHVNAAERAIATFKEHVVTTLATVDMLCFCPLQILDEFLPQVELTLNLLRFSIATRMFQPTMNFTVHLISTKCPLPLSGQKHWFTMILQQCLLGATCN